MEKLHLLLSRLRMYISSKSSVYSKRARGSYWNTAYFNYNATHVHPVRARPQVLHVLTPEENTEYQLTGKILGSP